jgi:nitrous oxidase accessory protein NosD
MRAPVTLAALATLAAANAQYEVTNLANAGAGSLRDAIQRMNTAAPSSAQITLRAPGTLVLSGSPLPACNPTTAVTIAATFAPPQRLVIDARPVSGSGAVGLHLSAPGSLVQAPIAVWLRSGMAIRVDGANTRIDDAETDCDQGYGLFADRCAGLVLASFVARRGSHGIYLGQCTGARLGSAAAGTRVTAADAGGNGLWLDGGSALRLEAFTTTNCEVGVRGSRVVDLVLGDPAARSEARGIRTHGTFLDACRIVTVQNAEFSDNAVHGFLVHGGDTFVLTDVVADRNGYAGVTLRQGTDKVACMRLRARDNVASGLRLYDCSHVLCSGCELGPGNQDGAQISNETAQPYPTTIFFDGGTIAGNVFGVSLFEAVDVTLRAVTIRDQIDAGVSGIRCTNLTVRDCVIARNPGHGIYLARTQPATIGPGNQIVDSYSGVTLYDCPGTSIHGSDIARHRAFGIEAAYSPDLRVSDNRIRDVRGLGMWLLFGANQCTIGPGNRFTGNGGGAIKLELCDGCLITGNEIDGRVGDQAATSVGVAVIGVDRGLAAHRLRSNLVHGIRDVGVLNHAGLPLRIDACTIADGWLGLLAAGGTASAPTQIVLNGSILWGNGLEDYRNVTNGGGLVTASYSLTQNPPGTGSNRSVDPRFVAPATRDYRLRPESPARDLGDPLLPEPGTLDAYGGARLSGRIDVGAHEYGAGARQLDFTPTTMPAGGGRVGFEIRYSAAEAGHASWLLMNLQGPGTPWSLFGVQFPLPVDEWMLASIGIGVPQHIGTLAIVPADGHVHGWIDYTGLVPRSLPPLTIHACALSIDQALQGRTVTNVATIRM